MSRAMYTYTEQDLARFWTKVEKAATCWEWTATKREGYGMFSLHGRPVSAHRFIYFVVNGEFDGLVRHTCDNSACVRPDHLIHGTQKDNMDDMYERGRRQRKQPYQKKESRKVRKLSHEDVREILSQLEKPYWGQVNDLAAQYGVRHSLISQIKTGRFVPANFELSVPE